uniref:Cleavage and polyadenylation specificity factor subunit 2 n=1 Tax=Acrobeloides nanus TaxID=290746 RepID=A0A914CJ17_9BILA
MSYIEAIKLRVPQINAVLLSYPDITHLGALPYLVGKCGLNCPIYATVPVYKMGQLFIYDWLSGHNNVEDFSLFNFDDIDVAFEKVQQVKYSQTILLKGDNGLQITPYPAGHMIGGAIWKLTKMGDEEIVYAIDFNHKKERHLNGCTFDGIGRPNLLITDSFNALYKQPSRKIRDELLVTKLLGTVRDGGDVMIVIDTAGRVLEIAHLLDQLWQNSEAGLMTYNLVMLSHVASSVVESAKSQVEWMSDKILRSFEVGRHNPFQFRYVKFCHSLMDLSRVRSPKVVLVSGLDMESGFSRELFYDWCVDTKNTIILTGRSGERTLGSRLIRISEAREKKTFINNFVTLEVKRRIRLEGQDLDEFLIKKKEKEQEAARLRLENVRLKARLENAESSDESDDEDAIAFAGPAPVAKAISLITPSIDTPFPILENPFSFQERCYDIIWKFDHQSKTSFKGGKKAFPMFPFHEEKTKWDDYGEIIRPEEYTIVEPTTLQPKEEEPEPKQEPKDIQPLPIAPIIEEWPTKCVSYKNRFEILCKVEFIDFEGRSDGESIKKILAQIKPKQLIIVHGKTDATLHLKQYCEQNQVVQGKIFTPTLGEVVDATIESHIFQVTLSDQLMSSLIFQTVKEAELSWIDARLLRKKPLVAQSTEEDDKEIVEIENQPEAAAPLSRKSSREAAILDLYGDGTEVVPMDTTESLQQPLRETQPMADDTDEPAAKRAAAVTADVLSLEVLPASNIPPHQAVFVNDPKLSDLKQLLATSGFHAEFSAGVLYVNNIACIRRNEAGRFHVEGCACDDYYRIREIVYAQFAIV